MTRLIDNVNPFIGVDIGNCLCGPYLPHSLVRLGPDTLYPQATNGYRSHMPIVHFTHTHVSGTGGGGRYGNIGVTPFLGRPRLEVDPHMPVDEKARIGYYRVTLAPAGITAELTSTPRTGVHRYRFPGGSQSNLLFDVGAVVQTDIPTELANPIGGFIEVISSHEIIGRGDYQGGWGHDFPYSVYFYARFAQPIESYLLGGGTQRPVGTAASGTSPKAALNFGSVEQIDAHVGISYVSIAKARASVDREVAESSFEDIRAQAENIWERWFERIQVTGGTDDQRTLFYTLFTRLICQPTDLGVDDEFHLWQSGVRHFTDFYCLWDSVRNANSLITLFAPEVEVDYLNCLLDVAQHIGWLPDAWVAGHSARIQGGSSADVLFCEARLKGLTGIDYTRALQQMRKNNEVESPDPWLYGRHLADYRDLGYVSTNVRLSSVSRHLEYTYQDWCIGRLAETLGQTDVAQRYYQSANKVWNLWRDDLRCFAPRKPDGRWIDPFDPAYHLPDKWNDPYFYEGNSWQWSFNVQHDFAGLIKRHGGTEGFIRHLDTFFEQGHYLSKETILHVPYLYHYAGRPDKTATRVALELSRQYANKRDGLSDDEDMGCQSAWYMCSMMGLYPIMGQDFYLLSRPHFESSVIDVGGGELIIEAPEAADPTLYVESVTLNGQPFDRAWIQHSELVHGAHLRFKLAKAPSAWGQTHIPPSAVSTPQSS